MAKVLKITVFLSMILTALTLSGCISSMSPSALTRPGGSGESRRIFMRVGKELTPRIIEDVHGERILVNGPEPSDDTWLVMVRGSW